MKEKELYALWCEKAVDDPDLQTELKSIANDDEAIKDRFYRDLEIGTGGRNIWPQKCGPVHFPRHCCGDVDFDSVEPVCGAITPVPGGVGPMTIAMLMNNCLESVSLQAIRG